MPKNYSELTAIGRALVSGDLIPMWGTSEAQTRRCTYGDIVNPLQSQIDANAANIATNTGNIATNTGNIATNTSDIAQNTTDIGNNTTAINANATALTTKVEGPAGATPDAIMVFNGATGYVAKDGGVTIASLQADIDGKMNNAASGVENNFLSFTSDNGKTPQDSGVSAASFDTAGAAAAVQADLDAHKDADNFHMTANQNAAMDAANAPSAGNAIATIADIASSGGGDVTGPPTSVNDNFALFSGTTGKIIKDAGFNSSAFEPAFAKNTAFNKNFGTGADTVCVGNDARLSDARTPTAHAASHADGGADELDVSDLASGAATLNQVPLADGAGGVTWGNQSGGGGDLSNAEFPDSAHFANHVAADATVAFTDGNKQIVDAATHANLTLSAPGVGSYILTILNSGSLAGITPAIEWENGTAPAWAGKSRLALLFDGTNWAGSALVNVSTT